MQVACKRSPRWMSSPLIPSNVPVTVPDDRHIYFQRNICTVLPWIRQCLAQLACAGHLGLRQPKTAMPGGL
jgi:hypothetical protein